MVKDPVLRRLPLKSLLHQVKIQEQRVSWTIGCKILLVDQAWHRMVQETFLKKSRNITADQHLKSINYQCRYQSSICRLSASIRSHSAWVWQISIQRLKRAKLHKLLALMSIGLGFQLDTSHLKLKLRTKQLRVCVTISLLKFQKQTRNELHLSKFTVLIRTLIS